MATNSGSGDFPIPGATNSTLTLLKLQPSSAGSIRLAATNALGSNTTSIATITILPALPARTAAEPYAFAVIGNHPRVYWRFSETNAAGAGNVPVYDYSGNGYDATYGLNSTVNVPGPQSPTFVGFEPDNTGVQFPGPNIAGGHGYAVSPSLDLNTNTATFALWLNPPPISQRRSGC